MRGDPKFADSLVKAHRGLDDENRLQNAIREDCFVEVMIAIWSERDRAKRLDWLRKKAPALQAPFLFELAIAEFKAVPTSETLHRISYPLLQAAYLRVKQDVACYKDASLKNLPSELEMIYLAALNRLTNEHLKLSVHEVLNKENPDCIEAIQVKWREILNQTHARNLPMPIWVLGSGTLPHPQDSWPQAGFLSFCHQERFRIAQEALSANQARLPQEKNTRVFEELD